MTNDSDPGVLLLPVEQLDGQEIRFFPSKLARENFLYLTQAGTFTTEGECLLNGSDTGYTLIFTISGAGHVNINERGCAIGVREGIFLVNGKPVRLCADRRASEPWSFLVFSMDGRSFPAYFSQLTAARPGFSGDALSGYAAFVRFKAEEGSDLDAEIAKLTRIIMAQDGTRSELIASTAIIMLMTELIVGRAPAAAAARPMPRYVEGIMKYIHENYRRQITLDELTAQFNVSKFHLSREFKKYTGYTPNDYLISVRMNRAKELLRHTGRTITEIAQITGCGEVNHFIQLFKSREKVTPAVFRRRWNRDAMD